MYLSWCDFTYTSFIETKPRIQRSLFVKSLLQRSLIMSENVRFGFIAFSYYTAYEIIIFYACVDCVTIQNVMTWLLYKFLQNLYLTEGYFVLFSRGFICVGTEPGEDNTAGDLNQQKFTSFCGVLSDINWKLRIKRDKVFKSTEII